VNPWLKWCGITLGVLAGVALAAVLGVYLASQANLDRHYPLPAGVFHSPKTADAIARGAELW
jgi:hypothetical protein